MSRTHAAVWRISVQNRCSSRLRWRLILIGGSCVLPSPTVTQEMSYPATSSKTHNLFKAPAALQSQSVLLCSHVSSHSPQIHPSYCRRKQRPGISVLTELQYRVMETQDWNIVCEGSCLTGWLSQIKHSIRAGRQADTFDSFTMSTLYVWRFWD